MRFLFGPEDTIDLIACSITAGAKSKVKSSAQRAIRSKVLEQFPLLEPYIEDILPKKEQLDLIKIPDRVSLYTLGGTPLFFQHMDDPFMPHLTLVHKYPDAFPRLRIDRGAIRFVLSGATLMAPGLTSAGGRLPEPRDLGGATLPTAPGAEGEEGAAIPAESVDEEGRWSRELKKGEPVVIMAEGKTEACAVGILVTSTNVVKDKGKGPVVEDAHFLGDGLWNLSTD